MTFHQLRHTHKTWMAEHHTPPSLQDYRMGHAPRGVQGRYEHHTHAMIIELMQDLQRRHAATDPTAAPTTGRPDSPLRCPTAYTTRPGHRGSCSDGHGCARGRLRKSPPPLENRIHRSR